MSHVDAKIEKYQATGLNNLPVTSLTIHQIVPQLGDAQQALTLELLRGEQTVTLAFTGLRQLRLANLHPGSLCGLNISSVADAQMEGLRYRVSNAEQDLTLDFYCADFEISSRTDTQ
jgi:hypothetical protein